MYYSNTKQASNYVGGNLRALNGYPLQSMFTYKWAGLDPLTGDPQGYLNNTVSKDYNAITGTGSLVNELAYIGSATPLLFGSVGNTVTYKSFSLSVRVTYKFRYWFMRESISYSSLYSNAKGHPDYENRWQQPGDEKFTNVPSLQYPLASNRDNFYSNSKVLATKGDHIRIQYITLSYNITKAVIKKLPLQSIRLYSSCSNIGLLWKANKQNLDPDYSLFPPAPSISLGLNINF